MPTNRTMLFAIGLAVAAGVAWLFSQSEDDGDGPLFNIGDLVMNTIGETATIIDIKLEAAGWFYKLDNDPFTWWLETQLTLIEGV